MEGGARGASPLAASHTKEPRTESDPEVHGSLVIPVTAADPQWGDQAAPVTVVQFVDLECPACVDAQSTVDKLEDDYGASQLRVVWKNFPLPFHESARPAHEVAVAIHRLEGAPAFFDFVRLALANQTEMTRTNLVSWAREVGAFENEVWREVQSGAPAEKIDQDSALANALDARFVPLVFVNGSALEDAKDLQAFRAVIEGELDATRQLLDDGMEPLDVYPARLKANYSK